MAKRSTIGENPLDFLVSENSLDTVVPSPAVASRAAKVEERLDRLEAGLNGLKAELAGAIQEMIDAPQPLVGQKQAERLGRTARV